MDDQVKCLTPWDCQSKRIYEVVGVYRTLDAGQAVGGQAHGICYAIEGHIIDRQTEQNGKGWAENYAHTLNATDRHAVCYSLNGIANYKECNPTLRATGGDTGGAVKG